MKLFVFRPVDAQYNLCYLISALLIYISAKNFFPHHDFKCFRTLFFACLTYIKVPQNRHNCAFRVMGYQILNLNCFCTKFLDCDNWRLNQCECIVTEIDYA